MFCFKYFSLRQKYNHLRFSIPCRKSCRIYCKGYLTFHAYEFWPLPSWWPGLYWRRSGNSSGMAVERTGLWLISTGQEAGWSCEREQAYVSPQCRLVESLALCYPHNNVSVLLLSSLSGPNWEAHIRTQVTAATVLWGTFRHFNSLQWKKLIPCDPERHKELTEEPLIATARSSYCKWIETRLYKEASWKFEMRITSELKACGVWMLCVGLNS